MSAGNGRSLVVSLFGPVRARLGDRELSLGPPQQRAVLALLALRGNKTVSRDELVDGIWGGEPPARAVNAVHVYVCGLRRALEPNPTSRAPARIQTGGGPGYLLRLEPGGLDAEMFCRHLAAARASRAAGDLPAALGDLDAGLALWLEAPLLGIPGPWADMERNRLRELRLTALEDRAEIMLETGRHTEAAAQLTALASEHPLRERLCGALMLARYRSGRRADALTAYADTRRVLIAELGVEPGPALQRLHARILAADGALDLDSGSFAAAGVTAQRPVPAQLPPDVHAFIGRQEEMGELEHLLAGVDGEDASEVLIIAVSGTAGVGKTALAVRWARRSMRRFTDGQLFVDLRGYDPDRPPVPSAEVLTGFLRALGMAERDIPADVGERAAAFRSVIAGRRMLVMLDNARGAEQIHALLPGSASCVVVVTSRDRLPGIIARHGARALELDVLPDADAVALLGALIGGRVDSEPDAAVMLAAQCARLPLALRVAAERAAANPGNPLRALSDELADERRGLEPLDAGGDTRAKVRSVFSWSYRNLSATAARAFRLLGLHPGPDLDLYAAVALTGTAPESARTTLDTLTAAHLVQGTSSGRYVMHDLLRAYAAGLPADCDETGSAMNRLLDYYLATAGSAMEALAPAERNRRPVAPTVVHVPAVCDPAEARAWLDAERPVLVAVTRYAARRGWPHHATRLAAVLSRYLVTGGYNTEAIAIHEHALDAASRSGDRGAQATALVNLSEVRWRMGRPEQDGNSDRALAAFQEIGDRVGEARAHGNLALLAWRQGRYAEASGHYEHALAVFRDIRDRAGEARALDNLGAICRRQGGYARAAARHRRALAIFRDIGDPGGQARALANLGRVHLGQECLQQAARCLEDSLRLSRETGDRACEGEALSELGAVHLRRGRLEQAADTYQQAIALFREIGHQADEAEALNGSGEVLLGMGRPEQARARHALALDLALQIADVDQQACAHRGLARAYAAENDYRTARHHGRHALDLYCQLDVPEVREVREVREVLDSLDAYGTAISAAIGTTAS